MLKKDTKSSQDLTRKCTKKSSIQCSVCNSFSTKTAFYVCDSGHVVCENCHESDGSEDRQDGGDFVIEKTCLKHAQKPKKNRTSSMSTKNKDLASGDHDKPTKVPNKEPKTKSECKVNMSKCNDSVETTKASENKKDPKNVMETIVEYKNFNYRHDDKSSTCSLASSGSKQCDDDVVEFTSKSADLPKLPDNRVCPRWYKYLILEFVGPVTCPVEDCNKMIALDSVMLHFYFDHSKVPRMTLSARAVRQIQIKPSTLSTVSQCLGIFSFQNRKVTCVTPKVDSGVLRDGNFSDNMSLLLMGGKIQLSKLKKQDEKSYTSLTTIHNVYTQTETIYKEVSKKKRIMLISTKNSDGYKCVAHNVFDDHEMILLWICKLDDNTDSFSISVIKEDKKQGHNYFGEAIHIREEQSPAQMFQRSECLVVSGRAANRLLDGTQHITVLINALE